MEDFNKEKTDTLEEIKCKKCGAMLKFEPGTLNLKCEYCGTENAISNDIIEDIEELDLKEYLNNLADSEETEQVHLVKCAACGADTTLDPNINADICAFCGTPLVVQNAKDVRLIKPKSLLPFKVTKDDAQDDFRKWVKKLRFAPNNLKKIVNQLHGLQGVYIPFWTYDSDTQSDYRGARGDYYYVNRTVTVNGKTETRSEKRTRWTTVRGYIKHFFDDILIPATTTLSKKKLKKLEPWDLDNITQYNDKFLSGFKSESYQVGLADGFEEAKVEMEKQLRELVKQDIGGDEQKITRLATDYRKTTFKHLLLPIWISSYRYNKKVYQILINARTGEVVGERPWSVWKITVTVLVVLGLIALAYFLLR